MKSLFCISIIVLSFGQTTNLFSQGCSDAGVCSIGQLGIVKAKYVMLPYVEFKLDLIEIDTVEEQAKNILKPDTIVSSSTDISTIQKNKATFSDSPKFMLSYLSIYGAGLEKTSILTQQLEGTYFINNRLSTQVKIPYQQINGSLGPNSGIGDITASISYSIIKKNKKTFTIVGGVKIAVNDANTSKGNLPLPMNYQTSLGTNDLLFGFNYRIKSWDLTVAYQHPLNTNRNEYLHNPNQNSDYNQFYNSRNSKRADDAVIRVNKTFKIKKIAFSTGLLGIYHIKNDQYENLNGEDVTIVKSQGLTLNFNFSSFYAVSKKIDLFVIFANPLINRESLPAGLARDFVVMGGIRLKTF